MVGYDGGTYTRTMLILISAVEYLLLLHATQLSVQQRDLWSL